MAVVRVSLADDVTVYVGDVRDALRLLPDNSVQCCVTSPPYWSLRDYGTARWEGGDQNCKHGVHHWDGPKQTQGAQSSHASAADRLGKRECQCGAVRIDSQIGLETAPEAYVATMVEVFREVRRVLRPDGTLWANWGDSYNGSGGAGGDYGKGGLKEGQPKRRPRAICATSGYWARNHSTAHTLPCSPPRYRGGRFWPGQAHRHVRSAGHRGSG